MSTGAPLGQPHSQFETYASPDSRSQPVGVPPSTGHVDRSSAGAAPRPVSVLDSLLASLPQPQQGTGSSRFAEFLSESETGRALQLLLDECFPAHLPRTRQSVLSFLAREIARLDDVLARQVNAILHHPRFQQLEASWRGLWMLTGQALESAEDWEADGAPAQFEIRVLTITKRDLRRDFESAVEFDQSLIFKKVYDQGLGMAGAAPFGALIGDFQFTNHPDDLDTLQGMAGVAAAAFAPFITAPAPELIGLDSFQSLEHPLSFEGTFSQPDYIKWNSMRNADDLRFVGMVLPRILMREPYDTEAASTAGFRFREEVEGPDRSRFLWGNAAYAFGTVLIRAFGTCRWFADIRGVERGIVAGGLVTQLPVHSFHTDRRGIAIKSSIEVAVNDFLEKELSTLGLIPICPCHDTEFSVFYTNASVHRPKTYSEPDATANAKISAMLQYILCASRFAHYLKVLARNKIGSQQTEGDLERELRTWIGQYVAADPRASNEIKSRYPLREANVEVHAIPGRPGSYRMVMHLLPHFQLDGLTSTLKLSMEVNNPQSR